MLSPIVTGSRRRRREPTLIALHGLNGSSEAHYMRGLAAKAFARGMNVVRLNQRNCGDTEHLSEGLFHSGLTADAAHVVDELMRVDGLSRHRRRRLLARRQPRAEAGGRVRRARAARIRRRGRRVADHRDQPVHARARAAGQRAVSVEFRPRSEAAHAAKGTLPPWHVRPVDAERDQDRPRSSTRRIRRPTSDSATPRTTTTGRARCA